ncbi:MAG: hypothetical protein JRI25_06730 [Deltaproteobacteria bacterium]|nr:hypothetical protein [Deltaproteobacteria bacterium]
MSAPVLASHIVPDLEEAVRLDKYLVDTFSLFPSRASARKAARRGEVLVDGEPRRSGSFVEPGHHIEVLQPVRAPPRPWRLPLELAFVDDWMAVVVKPPGVMVRGNHYRTLENALVATLPPSAAPGALRWANPVHRLDVRTGGLLLVARTGPAQVALGQMLEERSITKRYRALALGRLEGKGTVSEPIEGRDAVSRGPLAAHRSHPPASPSPPPPRPSSPGRRPLRHAGLHPPRQGAVPVERRGGLVPSGHRHPNAGHHR